MKQKVFLTCAVTGAGDTVGRSGKIPVTPADIAREAVEAARAGASVVHLHVRDPQTGKGCRRPELFREAVGRVRDSGVDVVLNLTAGMGGDLVLGDGENPLPPNPNGTDLAGPLERLAHVEELLPEICTLDCGSMNFAAGGNYVMINTPEALKIKARRVRELGVKPELEIFDIGNLTFTDELIKEELIESPPLMQLCMGIPYGMPADLPTFTAAVSRLPKNAMWSSFAIGRMQMPWVAVAAAFGGNVRIGLEDNLYLSKGVLATNAQLTEKAIEILERLGVGVMTPAETREFLNLRNPIS